MSVISSNITKLEDILIEYIDNAILTHIDIKEHIDTSDYLISLFYRNDELTNTNIEGTEYLRMKTLRCIKGEIKAKLEKFKYEVKAIDILSSDKYMLILVKKLL